MIAAHHLKKNIVVHREILSTSNGWMGMPLAQLMQDASLQDVGTLYLVLAISSISIWQVKVRGITPATTLFLKHSCFPVPSMDLFVSVPRLSRLFYRGGYWQIITGLSSLKIGLTCHIWLDIPHALAVPLLIFKIFLFSSSAQVPDNDEQSVPDYQAESGKYSMPHLYVCARLSGWKW